MVDFLFFQNLYVILLLCHDQTIEVQKEHHNKERGNKVHLYAIIIYIIIKLYNLYIYDCNFNS